jgi:hypothetical protein
MKQSVRNKGALIFILLLTLLAAVLAAQTSAQTPPKEQEERDFPRQKMAGSGSGRNPFSLPAGIHLRSTSMSKAVPLASKAPETAPRGEKKVLTLPPPPLPPLLKVRAILIGSQSRLALIDRHIVREGESIGEEKILVIAKEYVVLGQGDKKRTLFLQQSPVRLTVEEK